MPSDQLYNPTKSPMKTGLKGCCPRCQKGKLFESYLKTAKKCDVCGLDYSFADPADGPAFFVMSIVTVPVMIAAMLMELVYAVPIWLNIGVSIAMLAGGCLLLLPPLKGWLICSQYLFKAEEGRPVEKNKTPEN